MTLQKTDWGEIRWLEEKNGDLSGGKMQTGIVYLYPGAHQPRHIHYEEQVIYVLQGRACCWINGKKSLLQEGSLLHWPAGVIHEIQNAGQEPFMHLLVSNPESEEPGHFFPKKKHRKKPEPDLIYIAVEAIRTQFLETLHYGYAIFDSLGNLIVQSSFFPEYCEEQCETGRHSGECSCMRTLGPGERNREGSFRCPNGMEIFHCPIYFEDVFLGYIQSGYVRHSGSEESEERGLLQNRVYDVPESVITGIHALLHRIVKAIENYCEFEQFRRELVEQDLKIATQEEARRILAKNLKDTQYAVTELKINHHFLFNTLNSMASMALDGNMMPLYQSIVDLSKLFHYTLRAQNSFVMLEKETEYVKTYLKLQKLRYGDGLEVICQKDPKVMHTMVPFNFLQPVVENAFVHGFHEYAHKKLRIEIKGMPGQIHIRVSNVGRTLTEQECRSINQGIHSNTSHGLSMVYQKLLAAYGERCRMEISCPGKKEVCVSIQIPIQPERRSFYDPGCNLR